MVFKRSLLLFILTLTACQSSLSYGTPPLTSTKTVKTETPSCTTTPSRRPTITQRATSTKTPSPPTLTLTFLPRTVELTLTLPSTYTARPTQPTEGPGPGFVVYGYVRRANGTPVEGVNIYIAFASYEGKIAAATNSNGYYKSEYFYIPGDETIRVWAEAAGHSFKPASGSAVWTGNEFYWRHYFGFEDRSLDFTAMSDPVVQ